MSKPSRGRSKVARRIVGLFVLCALVPVCVLAVVAFRQVTSQLEQASRDRLRDVSKNTGMGIVERLRRAEADLALIDTVVRERVEEGAVAASPLFARLRETFSSIVAVPPDGSVVRLSGEGTSVPSPNQAEWAHMMRGRTAVMLAASPAGQSVVHLQRLITRGTQAVVVDGAIAEGILWNEETVAWPTTLQVLGPSQEPLFSSEALDAEIEPHLTAQLVDANGDVRWSKGDDVRMGRYWKMPLTYDYLNGPWTVVVSESQEEIMAPVNSAKRSFVLVMVLSLWVVALLSLVQIRRSLVPLSRLREATERVGAGRFDTTVEVRSGDEFEELAGSFNMMSRELDRQFSTLAAVADLERAVLSSLDERTIATRTIDRLPELLGYHAAACIVEARLPGEQPLTVVKAGSEPCRTESRDHGMSQGDLVVLRSSTSVVLRRSDGVRLDCLRLLEPTRWAVAVALPITLAEGVVGVVILAKDEGSEPSQEDLSQARQLVNQMSVALSNARLLGALDRLNVGTLNALARTVDAKSPWTAGHSQRVTVMAVRLGKELGLPASDLEVIERGGLLHDIGKIAVPSAILNKPGKLTDAEYAVMKEHPRTGARILEPIAEYHRFIPVVEQHHERWDGKGYPDGLAGENIHRCARVLAVADVFDALTSDRPYRAAMSLEVVDDIIKQGSGTHFDPRMVEAYLVMRHREMSETQAA